VAEQLQVLLTLVAAEGEQLEEVSLDKLTQAVARSLVEQAAQLSMGPLAGCPMGVLEVTAQVVQAVEEAQQPLQAEATQESELNSTQPTEPVVEVGEAVVEASPTPALAPVEPAAITAAAGEEVEVPLAEQVPQPSAASAQQVLSSSLTQALEQEVLLEAEAQELETLGTLVIRHPS
jgi:hypothetical protein